MAKKRVSKKSGKESSKRASRKDPSLHIYGNDVICATNGRGHAMPENRSPAELVVDATDGFIPLWGPNAVLRWRFNEYSMRHAKNATAKKREIRALVGEAMLQWGDAAPVKFTETSDTWDFEFTLQEFDNCSQGGCTLARAFFPDSGRHDLALYPILFQQSHSEQVETMIHELGHVFGLRHFFAQVSETAWQSIQFGTHSPFSIMNYGEKSVLTEADKSDLKLLYSMVWSGQLPDINGTPVVQFRPYHEFLTQPVSSPLVMQPIAAANICRRCGWQR